MPKIETSEKLFYGLIGHQYTDDELVDILPVAKAELDEHDVENHILKLELNDTNRPDLWSAAGLARAIRTYETQTFTKYPFFSRKGDFKGSANRVIIDDKSALGIRDYSIGFAARGKKVDEEILLTLIQSQEKLCHNYGRKRKTIALGIYRSNLINFPVHYAAVDPDKTKFVPLGMEEELSLREICEKHPKGKEYAHIVADKPLFPYLYDDKNNALSFPPIINSAKLGAVEVGDENLFIELSGPILSNLLLTASILSCDMADLGFEILPVKVQFSNETEFGKELVVPYYFQDEITCSLPFATKTLGETFNAENATKALKKMGMDCKATDEKVVVTVPEYRNDFLHEIDVVEDLMIGYGLGNFAPVMPEDFTIGRLSPVEEFSRHVKDVMVGLGYQEMIYNYLGSKREYIDNMNIKGEECVIISNPMSENFEVVRPSIFPSLLESESVSGHAVYPHKIFEVGKVCFKDASDNSGTTTRDYLGFLMADTQVGYNEASSYIQTLMYFLRKDYKLEVATDDTRFIPGRSARVTVNGVVVGVFGEVHPQVLENWGCTMPSIMAELDLDLLLS